MNIILAQLNYTIADFKFNSYKIQKTIQDNHNADIIIFSELAISGYYPWDLIQDPAFILQQNKELENIIQLSKNVNTAIVIGCVEKNNGIGKSFFNALKVIKNGEVVKTYRKQLLPTYNIFDEQRHFEKGSDKFAVWNYQNKNIGLIICEDGWNDNGTIYQENPLVELAKEGVDFIISINASPSDINKQADRETLFKKASKKYLTPIIYVNQVGANDSIVFDGASFITNDNGEITVRGKSFKEDIIEVNYNNESFNGKIESLPESEEEFIFQQISLGLKDYVEKCGFKTIVVGSSGGIDSALTMAIAAKTIGSANVVGITMPSSFSSSGSVGDSEKLCKNLGIKLFNIPIKERVQIEQASFEKTFEQKMNKLTLENIQARIRGQILMEFSNQFGSLVLSTGNKSELAVGYATLYGDMNGGLNLIGDLYKTEVYKLARYINEKFGDTIPEIIITKEPSAELSDGQKDQDSLPEYDILDSILKTYLENNSADIPQLISEYGEPLVKKILHMVHAAEFKRKQAPPIIRVHQLAFGNGRIIPIVKKPLF